MNPFKVGDKVLHQGTGRTATVTWVGRSRQGEPVINVVFDTGLEVHEALPTEWVLA